MPVTFVATLLCSLRQRLARDQRGLQIAESMAIAAFAIVAGAVIFAALRDAGTTIVNWIQTQITGGLG
jgi:hypothetical protein